MPNYEDKTHTNAPGQTVSKDVPASDDAIPLEAFTQIPEPFLDAISSVLGALVAWEQHAGKQEGRNDN